MSLNLQLPTQQLAMRPVITVVGVGGAGGNAVNNMISAQLEGVQFVVANTDAQALESALTERAIQLGRTITQGLGAGATPEIGEAAAEEAAQEIMACIEGSHMVFITAGMGGGTGTGAAPVVARMAREQGMLTVGVVTKPFQFEGGKRMRTAEQGLAELQKYVDTLIVIPNQNLFRIANEKTTFADAFRMADEVLHSGVRGVTDLMVKPGLVNLDFADIRTVMQEMGKAMMGTGEATGEKRAIEAAEAAISNPLLDDVSLKGARAALINITGGADMTLYEVDEAANRIREEIDSDANIIFGSTFNEAMQGTIRVSVVATGIDVNDRDGSQATNTNTQKNFAKPAPKPQPFKPTSAYYVGQKAPVAANSFSPQKPELRRDVNQGETKPASVFRPASKDQRTAQQPQDTNGFFHEAKPVTQHQQPVQASQPQFQPKPQEPRQQEAQRDDYANRPRQQTMDTGTSFVSPAAQQPASRQFQQYPADNHAATPPIHHAEQEPSNSFKILSRIADVGRSFNTRSEPVVSNRSMETKRTAQPEPEDYQQPQASSYVEDNHAQEEEQYYDIPAFLRRQAT
jgi:cell division protein FtsZ